MRLIDADALEEVLEKIPAADIKNIDGQAYVLVRLSQVFNIVKNAPTIEPEWEKGRWIIKETAYEDTEAKCSCCGFEMLVDQPGNGLHMVSDLHFCPNCGADMRGDQDDSE